MLQMHSWIALLFFCSGFFFQKACCCDVVVVVVSPSEVEMEAAGEVEDVRAAAQWEVEPATPPLPLFRTMSRIRVSIGVCRFEHTGRGGGDDVITKFAN